MKVQKRDGTLESVKFDKIIGRIKKQTYGLSNKVDPYAVAKKVIEGVVNGITTIALDTLAAEVSASMAIDHPDYGILAARIAISSLHKRCKKPFSQVAEELYNYVHPKTGEYAGLISDATYEFIKEHKEELDAAVVFDRDFNLDYFGFKTLEKSYLLKMHGQIAETPQHMWMRVSCGLWSNNLDNALKTYELMSNGFFTHATPTLFNAGTRRPQLSSCFLLKVEDSIESIFKVLGDCAQISKNAGGIGISIHDIRGKNAYIKGTNGTSNGIVPLIKTYEQSARYIDQGGQKRKGSVAVYLEPWHSDIFDFLDLRKNSGKEELRARDIFTAIWMPDLFMERAEADADWTLFSPDEAPGLAELYGDAFKKAYEDYEHKGLGRRTVKARELLARMAESQLETGTPYVVFKDTANARSNQQNVGVIRQSNLCCVAGNQRVPTEKGMLTVEELYKDGSPSKIVGRTNIESATAMELPRPNAPLFTINTLEGFTHTVTPDHKVWVHKEGWREAQYLKQGDKIDLQQIPGMWGIGDNPELFYKMALDTVQLHAEHIPAGVWKGNRNNVAHFIKTYAEQPRRLNETQKHVALVGKTTLLKDLQLLLLNFGIMSRIHKKTLIISDQPSLKIFSEIMLDETLVKAKAAAEKQCYATVDSIQYHLVHEDAYCLSVFNDEHAWVANGFVTKNSEILEYTSKDEHAVCNLASIALPRFVVIKGKDRSIDFQHLSEVAYQVTVNLNRVLDINYYPTPETKYSNFRHRPIGIGIQGLADVFALLRIPFDSDEARELDFRMMEAIYYGAVSASVDLAQEHGHYETYPGSPASNGLLQFDMAGIPSDKLNFDWNSLKSKLSKYGLRNSLLTALMPTASTSQILGNNECFEAFTSQIYRRGTLSGDFFVVNKHLVRELEDRGLWTTEIRDDIVRNNGSIQNVEEIPDAVKAVYKTVWEISQKTIIDMAAYRGAFVDQSQSMNLYIENANVAKVSSALFRAWKQGCKTGLYYLRTRQNLDNLKTLAFEAKVEVKKKDMEEKESSSYIAPLNVEALEALACSIDNPEACEVCSA